MTFATPGIAMPDTVSYQTHDAFAPGPSTLTSNASPAPSLPAELMPLSPDAHLQGEATFRFFGLQLYDIRLWAPTTFVADSYAGHPFALELVYARKLEGQAIAERSLAEMRRGGTIDAERARTWLAFMTAAFPDVNNRDRITGAHDGQGGVRFFFNGKPTAQLQDKAFARLFFGIWLSSQTSAPALRRSLLGARHGNT
jgi:hypothetical protein